MRPRNAGLKILFNSGFSASIKRFRPRRRFRIGDQLHHLIGAGIGGENDDVVFEVDFAAFAVFHLPLVEDLEEELEHVGMRLLHFIEQHARIGPPADRLRQHAAFAVAHVSGRRALQRRHRMRFLELRHVDGDQVVLAAVEQVGQRQRGLRLAHAAGPHQHEHAHRLVGIIERGARGLHALRR